MTFKTVSFVFQNTNHDGEVTQRGDIIGTCELNRKTLLKKFPDHEHYLPLADKNLSLSWNPHKFDDRIKKYTLAHRGNKKIPTPHRGNIKVRGSLYGIQTSLFVFWPINSPFKSGTNFPVIRKDLWKQSLDAIEPLIDRALDVGDFVVVMTDGNRPGFWTPHPGLQEIAGHGPDRIFANKQHKDVIGFTEPVIGPKTGTSGKVHHPSLKVSARIRDKR